MLELRKKISTFAARLTKNAMEFETLVLIWNHFNG